ncbi:hypothetical protein [Deinococcus phoenicis]|uniref:hypothetical protein n=1 Tax=Deinococcus phoenicis TaxID=1476583 RepID=UPI001267A074|nr:hypothetical protein [Deinococcus phoenicis]
MIERLPAHTPLTDALEAQESGDGGAWYKTQQEHWMGWLAEYAGPGAYGREDGNRDARFVYGRFQCSPGLLWLAEAGGVDPALVRAGRDAILAAQGRPATKSAAFRRVVPWQVVQVALEGHQQGRDRKTSGLGEAPKVNTERGIEAFLAVLEDEPE